MNIIYQILLLFVSLFILGKSAEILIKNLVKISSILNWSKFIIAFVILGIVTSTPEFFVGVNSAIDKNPQLSLGNILGATIVLLGLVVGSTAFLSGRVVLSTWFTRKEVYLMNGIILLPILLLYDKILSRFDAFIIIVSYLTYLYLIYSNFQLRRNQNNHQLPNHIGLEISEKKLERAVLFLILGFLGVFVFSRFAVNSAVYLGNTLGIQVLILGILIFSIGTNLPELVLTLTALRKKGKTLVVGNVLGSATTNSLILAVVSLIEPIKISDSEPFFVGVIFFIATVTSFLFIIRSKNDISKNEGLVLLGIYILFVITEIVTKII